MNLTEEANGVKLNSRVTGRELHLKVLEARQKTIAIAEEHAILESRRLKRTLIYQVKGHNLSGPLRKGLRGNHGQRAKLAGERDVPARRGTFLIVSHGMVIRRTNVKG